MEDKPEEPLGECEASDIAPSSENYYATQEQMKEVLSHTHKFWKGLCDQAAAIYNPQLVALRENGIIIGWVDKRTGMQPWFS